MSLEGDLDWPRAISPLGGPQQSRTRGAAAPSAALVE
jgi:hypothetical protein